MAQACENAVYLSFLPCNRTSGGDDGYVSVLDASGGTVVFSTLLGGSGDEEFTSIGVDSGGNIYISGSTGGPFPIVNAENGIYEPFRFCAPHSTCGGAALPPTQGIALKVAPVSGTVLAFPSVVNLVNPVAIGTSITATILVANPNSSNNITISGIGFTNSRLILEEACSRRTGRIGL